MKKEFVSEKMSRWEKQHLKRKEKEGEKLKKAKELVDKFYSSNPSVKLEDAKKVVKEFKDIKKKAKKPTSSSISQRNNHIEVCSHSSDDDSSIQSTSLSE